MYKYIFPKLILSISFFHKNIYIFHIYFLNICTYNYVVYLRTMAYSSIFIIILMNVRLGMIFCSDVRGTKQLISQIFYYCYAYKHENFKATNHVDFISRLIVSAPLSLKHVTMALSMSRQVSNLRGLYVNFCIFHEPL